MAIRLATVGDVAAVAGSTMNARFFYERLGFSRRAGYELLDKPLQENAGNPDAHHRHEH